MWQLAGRAGAKNRRTRWRVRGSDLARTGGELRKRDTDLIRRKIDTLFFIIFEVFAVS